MSVDDRRHAAEPDAFGDRAAFGCFRLAILEQMIHRRAAWIGDTDCDVSYSSLAGSVEAPAIVPPVPMAQMKPSILPLHSSQISGPVET